MSARGAVIAVAVLIAVSVGAALFIGAADGSGDDDAATATRPAATFTLPELREDRGEVGLGATPGQATVVNFFAAWCEPCKKELPAMQAASEAYPNVAFLGVDHQDSRLDAIELLDSFGVTYPAGYDPRGDVAARYAVRGLPATVFIDADGRIVDFHQGELSAAELRERLDRLTLRKPAA
ncbi:MAG: TlpA family protein disulfide reductase [Actinomycetota bacterium]|nr:TlpA family protein disulfide reductase [Actinomycetota bacterium]